MLHTKQVRGSARNLHVPWADVQAKLPLHCRSQRPRARGQEPSCHMFVQHLTQRGPESEWIIKAQQLQRSKAQPLLSDGSDQIQIDHYCWSLSGNRKLPSTKQRSGRTRGEKCFPLAKEGCNPLQYPCTILQ